MDLRAEADKITLYEIYDFEICQKCVGSPLLTPSKAGGGLLKNTGGPSPEGLTIEDYRDLKKFPNVFTSTFFLTRDSDGSGHQLNLTLNLIVAKEFAPVCRWFTRTPARRQPRRQAHPRAL